MSNLNGLYDEFDSNSAQEYDKEEYSAFKRNEKSKIYEIMDKTSEKVITSGDDFKEYLDMQSRFNNYSVGNNLLILAQMPKATYLRDFNNWTDNGIYIKKFEKAIKILEPAGEYMREDGSVGINYNVKKMYDISQVSTNKKPRNMKYDEKILSKLFLQSSNAVVEIVDKIPNTDRVALYNKSENKLYVARGENKPTRIYELSEELAKQEINVDSSFDKFKIYCVSYMLCKRYNIDVSNYKFDNIPMELQNLTAKEIREKLEPMKNAMQNISTKVDIGVQKIMRENKQQETVRI